MAGYFPFSLQNNLVLPPAVSLPSQQDLLDIQGTGVVQSARYINPATRDFELNTNGQFFGMNAVDQSVGFALLTTFNSSSVPGLGQTFGRQWNPLIGVNLTSQMTQTLNAALQTLINNGLITLGTITVTNPSQGVVQVQFTYFNNTVKQNTTVNFTLNNGVLSNAN